MAHQLSMRADGTAEMAYVGRPGWHGLGKQLAADVDIETAAKEGGFDWEIMSAPAQCSMADGQILTFPNRVINYRSDNQFPLSITSADYKKMQPRQILEYMWDLIARCGFKLNTLGMLFKGRQFWALADIGSESFIVDPRDKIKGRLLASSSCDLSLPTRICFVAERVVCWNTIQIALGEGGASSYVLRHRSNFNPDEVNEALGIKAIERFENVVQGYRVLAETEMREHDVVSSTMRLFDPRVDLRDEEAMMKLAGSKPVRSVIERATLQVPLIGSDLAGGSDTAWGWLNSVTQWVDHERRAVSDDARVSRAWFGDGMMLKNRAQRIAMNIARGFNDEAIAQSLAASGDTESMLGIDDDAS